MKVATRIVHSAVLSSWKSTPCCVGSSIPVVMAAIVKRYCHLIQFNFQRRRAVAFYALSTLIRLAALTRSGWPFGRDLVNSTTLLKVFPGAISAHFPRSIIRHNDVIMNEITRAVVFLRLFTAEGFFFLKSLCFLSPCSHLPVAVCLSSCITYDGFDE